MTLLAIFQLAYKAGENMSYLCKKPLTLFGKEYTKGEIIPDSAILPNRVGTLMSMKFIDTINVQKNNEVKNLTYTKTITKKQIDKHNINKNISE